MQPTPRFTLLRPSDFKRTPWKNGLGWTDQIAIHPEGADLRRGDFDWRVSTARIEQSSKFSPFPHHDRVLVVLDGAGVRLTHELDDGSGAPSSEEVRLGRLEPYEFPGDVPTHCELVDGTIRDFSVFARQGVVTAQVEPMELEPGEPFEWELQARTGFALAVRGQVTISGRPVQEGEVLRIDLTQPLAEPLRLSCDRAASLLLVQLG
jgi:environmental stress-induced protein Ves